MQKMLHLGIASPQCIFSWFFERSLYILSCTYDFTTLFSPHCQKPLLGHEWGSSPASIQEPASAWPVLHRTGWEHLYWGWPVAHICIVRTPDEKRYTCCSSHFLFSGSHVFHPFPFITRDNALSLQTYAPRVKHNWVARVSERTIRDI